MLPSSIIKLGPDRPAFLSMFLLMPHVLRFLFYYNIAKNIRKRFSGNGVTPYQHSFLLLFSPFFTLQVNLAYCYSIGLLCKKVLYILLVCGLVFRPKFRQNALCSIFVDALLSLLLGEELGNMFLTNGNGIVRKQLYLADTHCCIPTRIGFCVCSPPLFYFLFYFLFFSPPPLSPWAQQNDSRTRQCR